MKPSKRIAAFASVTFSIVMFWLVPGINTAKDTHYTRIYEDTDHKTEKIQDDTLRLKRKRAKTLADKKLYKMERINSTDKLSKIKASAFSRAGQFQEDIEINFDSVKVNFDSIKVVELDVMDSIELNPLIQRYQKRQK